MDRLVSIEAGYFKLDGGAMFGVVPKSIWEKLNPPDNRNLCTWALRLLYIEKGDRKILVDTGMGTKQSDKFFSHYEPHGSGLEPSLQAKGIRREEINDVFITHLHFDHVGGALEEKDSKIVPFFPNAQYWVSRAQWEWAIHPNEREKASFLRENIIPLEDSGKLNWIEKEGEWIPGISIRFYHGHTDGMMIPFIQMGENTLVYCADLLPSVGHIPLPYIMAYDTRPLLSLEEKKRFLQEACENKYTLFFEHDPINECCLLEQTDKGIRSKGTFPLHSILKE